MQLYEKIRTIRQLKGWSQEEIAHRLNMSVSGYGSIERGETDVNLSRLENIAKIFEIDLSELFNLNEKNIFVGDHNQHISQINSSSNAKELQHELEKSHLIIEQQTKEINYLKQQMNDLREINDLLKKATKPV
jgi:transcriptional regulator with XRE-family HTH domain